MRYIAFLRGINISGRNRIAMPELKKAFEKLGFAAVRTYLNSGNVLFDSELTDKEKLTEILERMIAEVFELDIPVFVIQKEELAEILGQAPEWWGSGNREIYDNLIFIMPPVTFREVYEEIGEPREGLERIENYENAVFWSFDLKDYRKTNWWSRTINCPVSSSLTIRTANTVRKLVEM